MKKLRSIFGSIASERPDPLPPAAVFQEPGATEKRGRTDDGHAGSDLLRARLRPDVAARARRVAREGGVTLGAYITAQVMNRPVPATVAHGMSDDFLARAAASAVVQELDAIERGVRAGPVDVPAVTASLRAIALQIEAGTGLTGEPAEEVIGEVFAVRVPRAVADHARAEAEACLFPSLVAYLTQLIENPRQIVPALAPDALAAGLPLTFAGSRIAAAVAHVLRRVRSGEEHLKVLVPEMRAVQRSIAGQHVTRRADYDRVMDAQHGTRDDVGWSAGFIDPAE